MTSPFAFDWVLEHAARTPEALALRMGEVSLRYGELAARVQSFAGALQRTATTSGHTVLVSLPTSPAAVVAVLGAYGVGARVLTVPPALSSVRLRPTVQSVAPRVLVVEASDASRWADLGPMPSCKLLALVAPERPSFQASQAFKQTRALWMTPEGLWENGVFPLSAMESLQRQDTESPAHVFRSADEHTQDVALSHLALAYRVSEQVQSLALRPGMEGTVPCGLDAEGLVRLLAHLSVGASALLAPTGS